MLKFLTVIFALFFAFNFCWLDVVAEDELYVSAKSAIVVCGQTGEVLFEKSAHQKLPMASTTKIMTALILAEQPDLSKTLTVTDKMISVEGSSMGLLEGDKVSYRDLLYGMLLASGNDAANTTAYALGGSIEGFAIMMNNKAKEIGMRNTSFVTPSGLDDENHYTTAYDLALLTMAALENTAFRTACSSKRADLYFGNPPYKRSLSNHNKLLGVYNGIIGVKTGYTKKSGRCLVTAAERDGKRIITVTLNAPDDWEDHKRLLDYGFENTVEIRYSNEDLIDILPIVGTDADFIRVKSEEATFCISEKSETLIKKRIILPKFVFAPVSAGETVGWIEYSLNNKVVKTAKIYSLADASVRIKKDNFFVRFFKALKTIWNYS